MESFVARLAVYNVTGFLRCVNCHWFFVVASLGCIIIAYIYYTNAERTPEPTLKAKSAKSTDVESEIFNDRLRDWLKLYKITPIEMYRLWIDPLNAILSKSPDSVILRVHSIEVEDEPSISDVKYEFIRCSTSEKSCAHFVVKIPTIKLRCETRRAGTSSWDPLSLQLYNFSVSLISYFHHNSSQLLRVHIDVVSDPNFSTNAILDENTSLSRKLADALRISSVDWDPGSSKDVASSFGLSNLHDSKIVSAAVHTSSETTANNGDLIKEVVTQPSAIHRGSVQCSSISMPDSSEFPLRNASSVEYTAMDSTGTCHRRSTGPKNLDRLLQQRVFRGALNGFSHVSSERLPEAPTLSSSSNPTVDDGAAGTPVVLAYNERIRQSMTARQLPRKSPGQLVRSASYYGENVSKVDSGDTSPAVYEPEAVGDPAPVVLHDDLIEPGSTKEGKMLPADQRLLMQQQYPDSRDYKSLTHTYTMESIQTASESPILQPITPHSRGAIPHLDSPSTPERGLSFLSSKKLLVKVVKAEELALKATSNAYCVVELDEPYQRHTTHCSSAGQLFWDQHLLFDLNTNSKRVALEVFELSKRKKSVSKGRAEQLLASLLCPSSSATDLEQDSFLSNPWDASEPRRRLPLFSTVSGASLSAPSATGSVPGSGLAGTSSSGTGTGVAAPGSPTAHLNPSITAEFHLMEKANEEALAARPRLSVTNQSSVQRAYSTRGNAQSFSAQDSPVLGVTLNSNSLSHSTSLEFGHSKFVHPKHATVIAEGRAIDELHATDEQQSKGLQSVEEDDGKMAGTEACSAASSVHNGGAPTAPGQTTASLSPTLRTAQMFSPVPFRRAQLVSYDNTPPSSLSGTTQTASPVAFRGGKPPALELTAEPGGTVPAGSELPKSPLSLDQSVESAEMAVEPLVAGSPSFTKGQVPDPTLQSKNEKTGADGLQRNDSLLKRSNMIGAEEEEASGGSGSQRMTRLPYPDSDFDFSQDDSNVPSSQLAPTSSRSHSLASRLRLLRSAGKRTSNEDSGLTGSNPPASSSSSLALLGPTRQLAGVVASMSTLPTDSGTSPSSAAALASAVAVAGATGSWQQSPSSTAGPRGHESTSTAVKPMTKARDEMCEIDPPVRYVPPAASVAAESPGTYTALAQPRRSDASNLSLFRLFRHKKKRFRSVGAEKLLYLENNDLEEFDAMSTEGYYRIAQDTDPNNQTPPPR